ncbi:hypothetical protein Bca52824_064029 [Brassica carinata]|uniref:Uncharacterized protein n=1 Tax=Brassica carinata TaxID=52824 RepID=A0A8X7U8Q3_BRACI|nr:hypothetical protein Bca52824_064029 [Brassica carinata]
MASSVVAKPCLFAQGLKTSTTPRTSTNRPLQDELVMFPLLFYVKLKASEMLRAAVETKKAFSNMCGRDDDSITVHTVAYMRLKKKGVRALSRQPLHLLHRKDKFLS